MPKLKTTKSKWEKEFASGKWKYLDAEPAERARSALIGMFCITYFPKGKILDVGCGLGTTADFLNPTQKKRYLGLDISETAIAHAKKKGVSAAQADFMNWTTRDKFDVIIFNEVLYYLDEIAALKRAKALLSKNGILIVSLYRTKTFSHDKSLWIVCHKLFNPVEQMEINAMSKRQKVTWRIEVLKQDKEKRRSP